MLQNIAYPQVVFRQADAPTDVNSGALWLDTDTNELYYYNGTSWNQLSVSVGDLNILTIENSLAILELQAAGTITPDTSATIADEVFTDTTGYKNLVDTGNTTAGFNSTTLAYANEVAVADAHGVNLSGDTNQTVPIGFKIYSKYAQQLISVTKHASCTATKVNLYSDIGGDTSLATATFSGNTATFSSPYSMAATTSYYIGVHSDGGTFNARENQSPSYPYNKTNINYTTGWTSEGAGSEMSNRAFGITSISTGKANADSIIQSTAITLPSTPTNFQVFAYRKTETGTGSIDCDISFDNGANYQTGVSLDTATEITDTGDEMILKLNLNSGASAGVASCEGFGVLFW